MFLVPALCWSVVVQLRYYWSLVRRLAKRMAPIRVTGTTMTTASSPPKEVRLVEAIERKTKRWLTIETSLTDDTLARCNSQLESRLYRIPKELRDLIFEYACTQSADPRHPYKETAYHHRPGHTARHKTYTSLLSTCRRIWLETNSLPMQQAEHCFWFQRGPYDSYKDSGWAVNLRRERDRYARFLSSLTTHNLQNLTHIHLFMQMFQAQEFSQPGKLEVFFSPYYLKQGLRPTIFQVTIRQSDWWNWEEDEALGLDEKWVQAILDAPQLGGVDEFRLELETLSSKRKELDPIVERLRNLQGKPSPISPADPNCQVAAPFVIATPLHTTSWSRSPQLVDREDWPIFKNMKTLDLHVVTLRWNKRRSNEPFEGTPDRSQTAMDQSPFRPNVFMTATHGSYPPSLALRNRSRRTLLEYVSWNRHTSFPWYKDAMWWYSVEQATKGEDVRRERLARMFADIEAKKLMTEWKDSNSLLRFGGIIE